MKPTTRLTLLTSLALVLAAGCTRTSPDTARSDTPTDANSTPPTGDDPGLEPIEGPVIDTVGRTENMTPTDGAAPNKPGTEDTGVPGGPRVNEVGSPPNSGAPEPK